MKLLPLILVLFLSGCFVTKGPIITDKPVIIDSSFYEECKPLSVLPPGATFTDVLNNTIDNASIYSDCKNKQKDGITILKKFTNVKDTK